MKEAVISKAELRCLQAHKIRFWSLLTMAIWAIIFFPKDLHLALLILLMLIGAYFTYHCKICSDVRKEYPELRGIFLKKYRNFVIK